MKLAQQQLEQGGFAGTVGTEQANAIATLDDHGEVLYQRFAVDMGERHILGNDDLLAGLFRGFHLERGFALDIAPLAALGPQRLERTHAAFVTGAPRLDALANPHFFLSQLLVEQCIGRFLGGQLLLLVYQEARVVAVPVDQIAAVQFEDAGRQIL